MRELMREHKDIITSLVAQYEEICKTTCQTVDWNFINKLNKKNPSTLEVPEMPELPMFINPVEHND